MAPFGLLAPAATVSALGWALLVGSVFILPALGYLYYSFERGEPVTDEH